MKYTTKRYLLTYLICCILVILLIQSSLSLLEFKEGQPFPGSETHLTQADPVETSSANLPVSSLFFQGGFSVLFFIFSTYLIILFARKAPKRKILLTLIGIICILGIVFLLSMINLPRGYIAANPQGGGFTSAPLTYQTEPLDTPPLAWQWWVALGMILISCLFALLWINRQTKQIPEIDRLAVAAEESVRAILMGDDLKSVILYSYHQMVAALREEQGIERDQAMTVREFEELLIKRGIPFEPVHQLSALFETVRYGNTLPSRHDKQRCLESLRHIIQHCKEGL
jgi:hypothetical protein